MATATPELSGIPANRLEEDYNDFTLPATWLRYCWVVSKAVWIISGFVLCLGSSMRRTTVSLTPRRSANSVFRNPWSYIAIYNASFGARYSGTPIECWPRLSLDGTGIG